MEDDYINDLKKELSESEIKKQNLQQIIDELKKQRNAILEENEKLNNSHIQNQDKISSYKVKLNDFQNKIKLNKQIISELQNEIMSQKKEMQDRVLQLLNIAKENQNTQVFSLNKIKNENPNNLNNLQENRINYLDEGNKINNKENIIDNSVDEEKEIKNKLFMLLNDKEKVDQVYEQYGKEKVCQLLDFNFKNENNKLGNQNFNENNNIINSNSNSNNMNNNIHNNKINSNSNKININNNNNNKINNNAINNGGNNNDLVSLKKKKIKYEQMSIELKEKCSQYHDDIEQGKYIIENYKNFLNEINRQIILQSERSQIMNENDKITINIDEKENLEFIESQIKVISSGISKLNDIYFEYKKNFGSNVEHLLTKIFMDLKNLNKKENRNDIKKLSIVIYEVGAKIEELQKICNLFEKNKDLFYKENTKIYKEVNKLQREIFKGNNAINQNNENEVYNILFNNDINNESMLAQSFLIRYKSQIFNKNNYDNLNGDIMENYIDEPKLIRKNWIEKCFVYDDKDVHDVVYDIKAISNDNKLIFNSCSYGFDYDKNIKIKYLTVDDVPVAHTKKLNSIEFKIKLSNSQTSKIHIIYDESKDLSKMNIAEIEERKIYREGKYGLQSTLNGQKAKYSLILKGSFDIVNFSEYFLIKNKENTKNIEYFWEGIVPYNGKITNIIFSKSEAMWSFSIESKVYVENGINKFKYLRPFVFMGGNNEIVDISYSSPQTKNIYPDEEHRVYILLYENVEREGDFFIKGILKNKSKGEWFLNITDEDLEKGIPKIDKILKPQLKELAKDIIEDFDRTNTNKDFLFLDYMKIGLWVHKNIKYDLKYTDKDELTPADVYYQRAGVSHHFTQLTNALLYALGYQVLYVMGYISQNNKEFDQDSRHSWTLIKLNNRWYPFDSTFGIFSGKLPISHIFDKYFYLVGLYGSKGLKDEKVKLKGIYIS